MYNFRVSFQYIRRKERKHNVCVLIKMYKVKYFLVCSKMRSVGSYKVKCKLRVIPDVIPDYSFTYVNVSQKVSTKFTNWW